MAGIPLHTLIDGFTAKQAVDEFEAITGFIFQPTVPGQLLARRGISKLGKHGAQSLYASSHWVALWAGMVALANDRAKFQTDLSRPTTVECPYCPTGGWVQTGTSP